MAFRKVRVKEMIIMSLVIALIVLPYFLVVHTPTVVILQSKFSEGLDYFFPKNEDNDEISEASLSYGNLEDFADMEEELEFPEEIPGLARVLKKAAMPDKTIILTTLNSAWARNESMIDLFLGSFHEGIGIEHYLNHLVIFAWDQASYNRCMEIHDHCFRLETEGVDYSGEKFFMTGDYLKMMWKRVDILRIVLDLGYNLLFSDADIMWFRDPFEQFSPDADFQIACDYFNGNAADISNLPNNGFVFVRSNERTISFYKLWYEARLKDPKRNEQDVFNDMKFTERFAGFGLKMKFLDTVYFGGFCQPSSDFGKVCTMHANCCTRLDRKINDLKIAIADWTSYKSSTEQEKKRGSVLPSWHAPKECLHSFRH